MGRVFTSDENDAEEAFREAKTPARGTHRPSADMPSWAKAFLDGTIEFRTDLMSKLDAVEKAANRAENEAKACRAELKQHEEKVDLAFRKMSEIEARLEKLERRFPVL